MGSIPVGNIKKLRAMHGVFLCVLKESTECRHSVEASPFGSAGSPHKMGLLSLYLLNF